MALPEVPKLNFSVALSMQGAFPVEANAFFKTYDEAYQAALQAEEPGSTNTIYYYTQILHVTEGAQAGLYEIIKGPDDGQNTLLKIDNIGGGGGGGVEFTTNETLTLDINNVLSVNTTNVAEEGNKLPITSNAVFGLVGDVADLLGGV